MPAGDHPDPNTDDVTAMYRYHHHDEHTQRMLVEEMEEDVATWEEIKVTALFTMVTSLAFLLIFELSRRKPSVAAVFDRRRATRPTRTPPPLMRSRIFEWVFLSTDPAYLEYSDMVHRRDCIRERRRQQTRSGTVGGGGGGGGNGGGNGNAAGAGAFLFGLPRSIVGGGGRSHHGCCRA